MPGRRPRERFGQALLIALAAHLCMAAWHPYSERQQSPSQPLLVDAIELLEVPPPIQTGGGSPDGVEPDPKKAGVPEPAVETPRPIAAPVIRKQAPPAEQAAPPAPPEPTPEEPSATYEELLQDLDSEASMQVPLKAARSTFIRATSGGAQRGRLLQGSGPGAGGGKSDKRVRDQFAFGGPTGTFSAQVCAIPSGTFSLSQIGDCPLLATFQADRINIPVRSFNEGFPGISERTEWFAIKYTGQFEAKRTGSYLFRLHSDDGSRLYIDGQLVIDNDGAHAPRSRIASVVLNQGKHSFVVKYFQGPRETLALQLFVTPPGKHEKTFRPRF